MMWFFCEENFPFENNATAHEIIPSINHKPTMVNVADFGPAQQLRHSTQPLGRSASRKSLVDLY